ncbi:hypothetical protein CCP3SC1AL1_1490005 [Gammaproteobacteria bacterium]
MKILDKIRNEMKVHTRNVSTLDDTSNELHEVYLLDKINEIEEQERESRLDRIADNKNYTKNMIKILSKLDLKELELAIKSDPIAERIYDYHSKTIIENILVNSMSGMGIGNTLGPSKSNIDSIILDMKTLRIKRK